MTVYCEICGETEQQVRTQEVGYCDECFKVAFREQTKHFFWAEPCAEPIYDATGLCLVCVEPRGTEHDHGRLSLDS